MLLDWVYEMTLSMMKEGKKVGLIGGDHSTPLGYIKALGELHSDFAVLQIDAHADLREAYEGFTYSHASIMYNVLKQVPQVKKLVQVGIRDYCDEELERKPANEMTVRQFDDDRPGTAQAGMTRRAGILATGATNERANSLATFRGRENLRKANNR